MYLIVYTPLCFDAENHYFFADNADDVRRVFESLHLKGFCAVVYKEDNNFEITKG